jgi:hypothetical protein
VTVVRCRIVTGFVLALAASSAGAENCRDVERRLEATVGSLAVVKDELGAFRNLGEAALSELGACPNSVRLWYLAARSAEVLDVPFADAAFSEYGGAKKIACDAIMHAPHSAPIATILARIDGTENRRNEPMTSIPITGRRVVHLRLP